MSDDKHTKAGGIEHLERGAVVPPLRRDLLAQRGERLADWRAIARLRKALRAVIDARLPTTRS